MNPRLRLLLLLPSLLLIVGCGGPPRAARTTLAELAAAVNEADLLVEGEVARRGSRAREQVMQEANAGTVSSVEQGLARFEEIMQPTTRARTAVRVSRRILLGAERGLDTWGQGAGPEDFFGTSACAVTALGELVPILVDLGLEVPHMLVRSTELLGTFTSSVCNRRLLREDP